MAEDALRIFTAKFGPLPFKTINIAEAPLVAGLGSNEFAGLDVIASAYYVDFDSPAMRNLAGDHSRATTLRRGKSGMERGPSHCSSMVGRGGRQQSGARAGAG